MTPRMLGFLALALLTTDAGAIEKWGPTWSEVTGNLYSKTQMNRTAAVIRRIDGKQETSLLVKTVPGKHTIVVGSPMRKGFSGTDLNVELDLEPCKRYFINAQFASGTGRDWEPVVVRVEPIAGCKIVAP